MYPQLVKTTSSLGNLVRYRAAPSSGSYFLVDDSRFQRGIRQLLFSVGSHTGVGNESPFTGCFDFVTAPELAENTPTNSSIAAKPNVICFFKGSLLPNLKWRFWRLAGSIRAAAAPGVMP